MAIPWHGLLVAAGLAQLILVVASLAIPTAQLTAFGSRRHRYLEVRSTYAFSMTPTDTIYGQFRRIGGGGASSPGP